MLAAVQSRGAPRRANMTRREDQPRTVLNLTFPSAAAMRGSLCILFCSFHVMHSEIFCSHTLLITHFALLVHRVAYHSSFCGLPPNVWAFLLLLHEHSRLFCLNKPATDTALSHDLCFHHSLYLIVVLPLSLLHFEDSILQPFCLHASMLLSLLQGLEQSCL